VRTKNGNNQLYASAENDNCTKVRNEENGGLARLS